MISVVVATSSRRRIQVIQSNRGEEITTSKICEDDREQAHHLVYNLCEFKGYGVILEVHNLGEHYLDENGLFPCDECTFNCKTINELRNHFRIIHYSMSRNTLVTIIGTFIGSYCYPTHRSNTAFFYNLQFSIRRQCQNIHQEICNDCNLH